MPLILKALKIIVTGLASTIVAAGLIYSLCLLRRPARTAEARSLFQGIDYERYAKNEPRPLLFHIVTVDLTAPGIAFLATPQEIDPAGKETLANTVPGFLQKHGVQVAINASFFYPFWVHTPFNYRPRVGEGANVLGIVVSEGDRYSQAEANWPALCIVNRQSVTIVERGECPVNTSQALAGNRQFVKDGQQISQDKRDEFFPRTAVALDRSGETMWLVIVDGRQPGYSVGLTLDELGEALIARGAYQALNFDGGGSTTLVIEDQRWADGAGRAQVLNSPIHARLPTNLRPVATHLGIYAKPLTADR